MNHSSSPHLRRYFSLLACAGLLCAASVHAKRVTLTDHEMSEVNAQGLFILENSNYGGLDFSKIALDADVDLSANFRNMLLGTSATGVSDINISDLQFGRSDGDAANRLVKISNPYIQFIYNKPLCLHGGVAVPFLIGLGCNVPAISAAAASGTPRERLVSAILITFVPCSARSAIILAIGGKYLGSLGVIAIFALTLLAIALLGKLLAHRYALNAPGIIQAIPPYTCPQWRRVWRKTWERTEDIITIVTPLLIAGSIVLALLSHFGADRWINTALTPITVWWLGLPVVLGVPILFGVLRKELSLLMIYQALGTFEIMPLLNRTQIFTFLIFLTFYIPCLSTFAVLLKALGRRHAYFSVLVSLGSALLAAGAVRLVMEIVRALT